jgi:uncharacterized membrane protein HdeD (DUF308 family)
MMSAFNKKSLEDVQKLKKKVNRCWWEDGISEILWGLCYLLVGSGDLFLHLYGQHTSLKVVGTVMIVAGVVATIFLLKYFKAKYVWSETGYAIL